MGFKLGGKAFSHANGACHATPQEGKSAHQNFQFVAVKSLDFDPKLKAVLLKGFSNAPAAIVAGDAEPEFKIGLDVAQQSSDYAQFCGDGFAVMLHEFVVIFQRSGIVSVRFEFLDCIIESGFGWKSESGGAPNAELSGKCRKILVNGLDPFVIAGGGPGGSSSLGGISASLGLNLGPVEVDVSLRL